jgi:acyl-CoA thioester hydrolase
MWFRVRPTAIRTTAVCTPGYLPYATVLQVEAYPSSTEIRVRFAETDAQGVAHHAAYLVWFEVARVEYLERHAGGYPAIRERGLEATTNEARVRYRAPVRFDDRLTVHVRCAELRGARFRFDYAVERDGELVADGSTGHACIDARTLRPTRVPEWLRAAIVTAESSS